MKALQEAEVVKRAGFIAAGIAAAALLGAVVPTIGQQSSPRLTVEDLGVAAVKPGIRKGPLVPKRDGRGTIQVLYVFPPGDYRTLKEPFEIVGVDTETGEVTRSVAGSPGASLGAKVTATVMGRDGRLYLGTSAGPPHLISWSPDGRAVDHGRIWADTTSVQCLELGTDGAIYGGGGGKAYAFRFDPKVGRIEDLGTLSGPRTYPTAYVYSIGADDRYVYAAAGKIPWQLVAYDLQTGRQSVLLTRGQEDFLSIIQRPNGVYANALFRARDGKPQRNEFYRLEDGKAEPVDRVPAYQRPLNVPADQQPELVVDDQVDRNSNVRVWIRGAEDKKRFGPGKGRSANEGWRSASIRVPLDAMNISRVTTLPDGRILGASTPYGPMFLYDPRADEITPLGDPIHTDVYSMLPRGKVVYFSGYPSAPLSVWDPSQPWTVSGDPDERDAEAEQAQSNPRRLAYLSTKFKVHHGRFMTADSRGRIIVAAHAERERVGGAVAIYDPADRSISGVGEELFAQYDAAGLAATRDGAHFVYSSQAVADPGRGKPKPAEAKLFVFQSGEDRPVREIAPLPGASSTGVLAPGAPGQVVGIARIEKSPRSVVYAVDVRTGEVEFRKEVGGVVSFAPKMDANGMLWVFSGSDLLRIDPVDGDIQKMGIMTAGDITIAGRDLYVGGAKSLRRVRNIVR